MQISFAPLEGITGWLYRSVHHAMFPGLHTYYTPFWAPTADSPLSGRGLADVLPDHNQGVPLVPQLLTNRAEDFIAAAKALQDLGYQEVNLNLGCPSGTVTAKRKGSGFLSLPEHLDQFFAEVFSGLDLRVSVKTRLGLHSPEEWPGLLEIFNRYPIAELTIHPRIRTDFYREALRMESFRYAVSHTDLPLCFNGDLTSPLQYHAFSQDFPAIQHVMIGRGLVANPALAREIQGGPPLTKEELMEFHARLLEGYASVLSGDRPVLGKMKELWFYWSHLFPAPEKPLKAMRKARTLSDYTSAVQGLFRDQDLLPGAHFSPF
ncbi:MAG: tRNA-dihydrouridine synthase family protein [Evtepia sp.]|uniref:tRNA dihydrouridine synthase n=1 Tax=Evtepia sp. TaxID=2773933 RepID=UPI002A763020|nr:tRNA-dihydrouridine synthase family protein [Evtepia sp.]MDY3014388.1 tRNA-dihydrouridine synthase family protein [Evtepia sp.]